jgi:post-segregation antitoxin (ccd killing protein)
MPTVRIALNEDTLVASRHLARQRGLSLSRLVSDLLSEAVRAANEEPWPGRLSALADEMHLSSAGCSWSREDLHER